MKRTTKITFVLLALLTTFSAKSQFGDLLGAGADAAYEKKLSKSPAKDLIIKSDVLVSTVNNGFRSNTGFETLLFTYKSLPKSIMAYDSLSYYKEEILKLDPKWKLKKINNCLEQHLVKYNGGKKYCEEIIAADKQFDDYETYLSSVKDSLSKLRGKSLYDYVTGANGNVFNLEEYKKTHADAVEFQKTYTKYESYKDKPLKQRMDGLNFMDYEGYQGLRYYVQEYGENSYNEPRFSLISKKDAEKYAKDLSSYKSNYFQTKAYQLLLPDFEFNNNNYEITKKNYELVKENIDAFAVSEFHKEHLGEIFFSDHKVTLGNETAADYKTDFMAGEAIYVTHYLSKSRSKNVFSKGFTFEYHGFHNSVEIYPAPETDDATEKISVFQFTLLPKADDENLSLIQKVRISQVGYHLARKAAEGITEFALNEIDFTIDFSNDGVAKIQAQYKNLYEAKKQFITLPKAGMHNATIEASIREGIRESIYVKIGDAKIIKTIIISKEFGYVRNKYSGRIEKRYLDQIAVLCKDEKGECFMYYVVFSQNKIPNGYGQNKVHFEFYYISDDTRIEPDGDRRFYFDCSKL